MTFDRTKSLQELENHDWGEPNFSSGLVLNCHKLRRKPLRDCTSADLCLMIGQNIGLDYLVPLALEFLADDPLLEGRSYHGDLLLAVLRIKAEFWQNHSDLWWEAAEIVTKVERIQKLLETNFTNAVEYFQAAREDT